jgi:uncharacterized protein YbbC (DUF1343 family)
MRNKFTKSIYLVFFFSFFSEIVFSQVVTGAEQPEKYLPLLQGKKVGVIANHTAVIGNTHLVDSLLKLGVKIIKVYSPEHGFRGTANAGEKVNDQSDEATGLPIVSLYGKNKKPTAEQIKDIDVLVFDIQDVGVRFYTYISTMTYCMEAAAESNKEIIVLDRPNPNGHFVDGPILEKEFSSFIGLHEVPIAHGMTVGEYAQMVNGEGWLSNGIKCNLSVIVCNNYSHTTKYNLPIKPSPNLPNMSSVYLYPSVCLFEGTAISVGRGTDKPFQVIGHPDLKSDKYSFTPKPNDGAKEPKLNGKLCYGFDLSNFGEVIMPDYGKIYLFWLINVYNEFPDKKNFFTSSFNLLAGNDKLKQQIISRKTEAEIRNSWQDGLKSFKQVRKKYLLYNDFE